MTPTDYPREEIMRKANDVLREMKGQARVYFKFTCVHCGERVQFQEPNTLFERGECSECGVDQPVNAAGFALVIGDVE